MAKAKGVFSTPRINSPAIPEKDRPAQAIVSAKQNLATLTAQIAELLHARIPTISRACTARLTVSDAVSPGDVRRTVIDR